MATPLVMIPFDALPTTDLVVDAVYQGGSQKNAGDDPIGRLLPVGLQGGFRPNGSPRRGTVKLVALYTSNAEPDWPDDLDERTGIFTYFGDNRRPGNELHETPRNGNLLLRNVFAACHGTASDRTRVPPFLLFSKAGTGGRDVQFRGLLAPGGAALTPDDDLQAIWRSTRGTRFQNYRAHFSVLDVPVVKRAWVDQILANDPYGSACPSAWRDWVQGRSYDTLVAPSTAIVRSRAEQLPADSTGNDVLATIHQHFAGRPHAFELCAVEIWRMHAPATGGVDVTRPSRDGGRDAMGVYQLGPSADRIGISFSLEAKCYAPSTGAGVADVSRLISRIRHRQFGVFVTTSYVAEQAYREIRADEHPVCIISGRDIVTILRSHGFTTPADVQGWLRAKFELT